MATANNRIKNMFRYQNSNGASEPVGRLGWPLSSDVVLQRANELFPRMNFFGNGSIHEIQFSLNCQPEANPFRPDAK